MAAASAIIANVAVGSAALRSALSQKLPVARFNKLKAAPLVRQRASVSRRLSSTVTIESNSKVMALPRVEGLRSFSVALEKPWLHQAGGVSLRARSGFLAARPKFNVFVQAVSTIPEAEAEAGAESSAEVADVEKADGDVVPTPLKTKKLTKQVKHIMSILNAEAVEAASKDRNFPILRAGDVVQLRVEVPENKRRVSLLRGIVIAVHNAGINSTFRIRRVLAGVGVELVFPLYSPNLKELKVVDKRKARRAKLYYLRDKIARMSSC